MNSIKYTVDQIDQKFAALLQHSDEENQLLIPLVDIDLPINEGDIVLVDKKDDSTGYNIKVLIEETNEAKEKVKSLIEKLKNK